MVIFTKGPVTIPTPLKEKGTGEWTKGEHLTNKYVLGVFKQIKVTAKYT